MPTTLPPVGAHPVDKRLRRLYDPQRIGASASELCAVLAADRDLKQRLEASRQPGFILEIALDDDAEDAGAYISAREAEEARRVRDEAERNTATGRLKRATRHHGGKVSLAELHLAFMGLRERLDMAIENRAAKAGAEGVLSREGFKEALKDDALLRYLIEHSEHNKLRAEGGCWCDNIYAELDSSAEPLVDSNAAWRIITGEKRPTKPYKEQDTFRVELRRDTDGLQGQAQSLVGGPILATLEVTPTMTVSDLLAAFSEATSLAESEQIKLLTADERKELDEPLLTLDEVAQGLERPFPRQLLVHQPLCDFDRSLRRAVRSRIRIHADINLDLPAVVVSDTAMQGHTPAAEIVLECGTARLFTGDGKGSGGGETWAKMSGSEIDDMVHKVNMGISRGGIHDDEGAFHDTVDFALSGLRCYVLWTVEGMMTQLDEDGDGELDAAELNQALQLFDTKLTASDVDADGDGTITVDEMRDLLLKPENRKLSDEMRESDLIKSTALEARIGQSYLPSDMLRHRYCLGFPRTRAEVEISPIDVLVDMRDMSTINALSASGAKGANTVMPVDRYAVAATAAGPEAEDAAPDAADDDTGPATKFDIILGRKDGDKPRLDGTVPSGAIPVCVKVRRAGVSILTVEARLRVDVLRQTNLVTKARGEVTIFGACENEERGSWEPWLEPWTLCFSYTTAEVLVTHDRTPSRYEAVDGLGMHSISHQSSISAEARDVRETLSRSQGRQVGARLKAVVDAIELTAAAAMTLNISYALVRDALEIKALLAETGGADPEQGVQPAKSARRPRRRVDLAHSPFVIYNDTGQELSFRMVRGDTESPVRPLGKYEKTWLRPAEMESVPIGSNAKVATSHWHNLRRNMAHRAKHMVRLEVQIEGVWVTVPEIRKIDVSPIDHATLKGLLCTVEINPQSGHKTISLRSPVQLHNRTDVDLRVKLNGSGSAYAFSLPAGKQRSVPVDVWARHIREGTAAPGVQVRPERSRGGDSDGRGWSKPISLEDTTVGNPYRDAANKDAMQVFASTEEGAQFHCHAMWCALDDSLQGTSTLAFLPFMTIVNELPSAVRIELLLHTDGDEHEAAEPEPEPDDGMEAAAGQNVRRASPLESVVGAASKFRGAARMVGAAALAKERSPQPGAGSRRSAAAGSEAKRSTTIDLDSGEVCAVPCVGDWRGCVTVSAAVVAVDLLFPPIARKLRGMFDDMDVDMDGHLSAHEILNSWDTVEGLDDIFQELLPSTLATVKPGGFQSRMNGVRLEEGDVVVVTDMGTLEPGLWVAHPEGQPTKLLKIPAELLDEMDRGKQILHFLHPPGPDGAQRSNRDLGVEDFVERFRFPEQSNNVAKHHALIYHQHIFSSDRRDRKQVPPELDAAWKADYPVPLKLPLERANGVQQQEPVEEGQLSLKYEFSLQAGEPVLLHLFCSHWLVNCFIFPLDAQAGEPIDDDASTSKNALSGVIGGSDIALRGVYKGVTGVFTAPVEGLKKDGLTGLTTGMLDGVKGLVQDTTTGVFKLGTNVVSGTVNSANTVLKSSVSGVTGVFTKPIEGLQEDGVQGLAMGVGKGLLGAVMKPATGAIKQTLGSGAEAALDQAQRVRERAEDLGNAVLDEVGIADAVGLQKREARSDVRFATGKVTSDDGEERKWGPVSLGQMIPAQGERAMRTVAVRGYQLLGCDTGPDTEALCLQLKLTSSDLFTDTAPIKEVTWKDPLTGKLKDDQTILLNLPEGFQSVQLPVVVKVRAAPLGANSKIVSISSPWTVCNESSYPIHVRTGIGQYEVLEDVVVAGVGDEAALQLHAGERIDAIGQADLGGRLGFNKIKSVCFMKNGAPHWCAIKVPGHRYLRRTDRPVLARYRVVVASVPMYKSNKHPRGKTGEYLQLGEEVDVMKIAKGRGRDSYLLKIDRHGEQAWVKASLKGVIQLEEVFDPPHGASLSPAGLRRSMSSETPRDRLLSPGRSSYHFDVTDVAETDDLQSVGVNQSSPIMWWRSEAERMYMRVAVASSRITDPLMWSQALHLEESSDDSAQRDGPTDMVFQVMVPSKGKDEGCEVKYLSGHMTEPGVLVLRDAQHPPYVVHNTTGYKMEYRVEPSSRPWWHALPSFSEVAVWSALQTNGDGVIDEQGRVDERRVPGGLKVIFRIAGDDREPVAHYAGAGPLKSPQYPRTIELGEYRDAWKPSERKETINCSVQMREAGSIAIVLEMQQTTTAEVSMPPRLSLDVRMQGIHCCFVDKRKLEWARLAIDSIRAVSEPVGSLLVSVISASELVKSDMSTKLGLFGDNVKVTVEVLGEHRCTETDTSRTPTWHPDHRADVKSSGPEDFQFQFAARSTDELQLKVWDEDKLSDDDILGEATVDISTVAAYGHEGCKETLHLRVPDESRSKGRKNNQGKLVVVLRFDPRPRRQPQLDELTIGRLLMAGTDTDGTDDSGAMRRDREAQERAWRESSHDNAVLAHGMARNSSKRFIALQADAVDESREPPNSPIVTMQKGFHVVRKSSDHTRSHTQTKAMVIVPHEVNVNCGASFFHNATAFAASLLPLMRGGSPVALAVDALDNAASEDGTLVDAASISQVEMKYERPEAFRIEPADVKVALDLDRYINGLDEDMPARALAAAAGLDLRELLEYPGMTIVRMVVKQFVGSDGADKELSAKLDKLYLPKRGTRMSPAEFNSEVLAYQQGQVMQLVYTIIPNPLDIFTKSASVLLSGGNAVVRSVGLEGNEAGADRLERQHSERESDLQLKAAQTFNRPGRAFGPNGELLPYEPWARSTALVTAPPVDKCTTVLLISSACPRAQLIAAAAQAHQSKGVLPLIYDEDWDSPADIMHKLRHQLAEIEREQRGDAAGRTASDILRRFTASDSVHTVAVMGGATSNHKHATLGGVVVGNTWYKGSDKARRDLCMQFWRGLSGLLPEVEGRIMLFMCNGGRDQQGFTRLNGPRGARAQIEEALSDLPSDIRVSVVPRAPADDLRPNDLTAACSGLLDPAVFYLWVDGSARGVARAMASALHAHSSSPAAGTELDVLCTGNLDLEVPFTREQGGGLFSCSVRPTAERWKLCEFHLDGHGYLRWAPLSGGAVDEKTGKREVEEMHVLSEDTVVQYHDDSNPTNWVVSHGTMQARQALETNHDAGERRKHATPPNVFTLSARGRTLRLQASSPVERARWVEVLTAECKDFDKAARSPSPRSP